jgi:hypothetical protein
MPIREFYANQPARNALNVISGVILRYMQEVYQNVMPAINSISKQAGELRIRE